MAISMVCVLSTDIYVTTSIKSTYQNPLSPDVNEKEIQCTYLSIGKQCVHPLEEARLKHVGLVKDEDNLLVPAARATQDCTQIIIKVSSSVLAMDLMLSKGIEMFSIMQRK